MALTNRLLDRFNFSRTTLFLFIVTLFIRLPFFFRDYIDRDESTFILMGRSIAEGHLPYVFLWDLKPPLLFYIFGFVEYIFPDSLVAIRVFGLLIIFCSALILIRIARAAGLKNGLLIALPYILLSSMFGSVQGVMSEHIAAFFMLAAVLFWLKKKTTLNLLFAGILFGCALLCKMNYAHSIPLLLLYYVVSNYRSQNFLLLFRNTALVVTGIIIPFVLVTIPFIAAGKLDVFIDSVFLGPFEYGHTAQLTFLQKLKAAWWVILLGGVVSYFAIKKARPEQREAAWTSALILMATIYTFYSIGAVNGHYLIQVYPFLSLLIAGIIISKEYQPRFGILAVFILFISFETWMEYYRLAKNYRQNGVLYNGKSLDVIRELKARNIESNKVFFANYHIGYWFLHQYPLTKSTTHPSTLTRQFLFKYAGIESQTSLQELTRLMEEVKPEIIVSRSPYLDFFSDTNEENVYFKKAISNYYTAIVENGDKRIYIWQRKAN